MVCLIQLDPTQMCMRISQDTEDNPVIPLSNDLLKVMQNNRQENKDIKWQYFGTASSGSKMWLLRPSL